MSNTHTKDGSKTSFYNIAHCEDYDDLAEYLELDGFEFNIGKSLFANIGNRHDGTSPEREAKKCLHYAIRRAFKKLGKDETARMMQKYMLCGLAHTKDLSDEKQEQRSLRIKKLSPTEVIVDDMYVLNVAEIDRGSDVIVYMDYDGKPRLTAIDMIDEQKIIGGFHYGLVPYNFSARNNIDEAHAKALAGINAFSIWEEDVHMPNCNPSGMTYVPPLDLWVDIYMLNSMYETFGTSYAGVPFLAGGNKYGRENPHGDNPFLYKDFEKAAKQVGKTFLTFDEFIVAARGVKEFASAGDDGTTKHNADFISMYGLEQATGHNWIWSERIDDKRAVLLGGARGSVVLAGSRSSGWSRTLSGSFWSIGCRLACDPLKPASKMSGSEFLQKVMQ